MDQQRDREADIVTNRAAIAAKNKTTLFSSTLQV